VAPKGFFISYTGADQAWAEWIAETLELAGHSTVVQAWDFRPGQNFIQRMNQALAEAEWVLAVLSPAYFASEYAQDEWTAALIRDRGQADRLVPVRVVDPWGLAVGPIDRVGPASPLVRARSTAP